MTMTIKYRDAPLGHEVSGIDVRNLTEADFRELESFWDQNAVIVIAGQTLTPDDQVAFSRRFGPLDHYTLPRYNMKTHPEIFVVSNVVENGVAVGLADAGRYWHSDMWTAKQPPRGSMLYALEVPHDAKGEPLGDTCVASMYAAYDALPESLRSRIEGRKGVYSLRAYVDFREKTAAAPAAKDGKLDAEGMAQRNAIALDEIAHPLVRVHPRTRRKCVYWSEGAIDRIEGYTREESQQILEDLRAHCLQPKFSYRHRWRVGDILLWDNCSSIHKATGDFEWPTHRRRMHRTTLADPIAA